MCKESRCPQPKEQSRFVLAQELLLRCPVLRLCPLRLASAESGSGLQEHGVVTLLCCPARLFQRVNHFSEGQPSERRFPCRCLSPECYEVKFIGAYEDVPSGHFWVAGIRHGEVSVTQLVVKHPFCLFSNILSISLLPKILMQACHRRDFSKVPPRSLALLPRSIAGTPRASTRNSRYQVP